MAWSHAAVQLPQRARISSTTESLAFVDTCLIRQTIESTSVGPMLWVGAHNFMMQPTRRHIFVTSSKTLHTKPIKTREVLAASCCAVSVGGDDRAEITARDGAHAMQPELSFELARFANR